MKTPEEVNRQHLIAMGLEPDLLGKPYTTEEKPKPNRCSSYYEDVQCVKPAGHEGIHLRGDLRWGSEDK